MSSHSRGLERTQIFMGGDGIHEFCSNEQMKTVQLTKGVLNLNQLTGDTHLKKNYMHPYAHGGKLTICNTWALYAKKAALKRQKQNKIK